MCIVQRIQALADGGRSHYLDKQASAVAVAPPPATPSTSSAPRPSIWDKLDRGAAATATSTRSQGSVQHELELYTSDAPIARSACPLQWWKTNSTSYPLIGEVARRLLSVPATSVASECLFSRAGDVITKKRNQLSPSCADRVLFLMENL